jgi:hypothetical protein
VNIFAAEYPAQLAGANRPRVIRETYPVTGNRPGKRQADRPRQRHAGSIEIESNGIDQRRKIRAGVDLFGCIAPIVVAGDGKTRVGSANITD